MGIHNQWNFLFVFILTLFLSEKHVKAEVAMNFTCPDGWDNVGASCLLFVGNKRLWKTSQETCESFGANLVKISDFQSNLDIGEFAKSKGEEEIWIGLNRREVEKTDAYVAEWAGGSSGSVYQGWWLNNEPNVNSGDCVLQKKQGNDYKWWFSSCEKKASFVCEVPVCAEGMFHCRNGECRHEKFKCDGINDCEYGSDEINCPKDCKNLVTLKEDQTVDIKSPDYPSDYTANLDCQWVIESPVGTNVYLTFTDLMTEKNADIIYVHLDHQKVEKYSGDLNSNLPNIVASSNMMRVTFSSDSSSQSKGFMAQVKSLKSDLQDREMLTATSTKQNLTSPFRQNGFYLNNQNYVWIIQAEHRTQIITLEKIEVDLMDGAEIIIRDGDMVFHPLLTKITSKDPGQDVIQSTGNKMYVLFYTYGEKSGKGFTFSYKEGCSIDLKEETGMIYSPGYPVSKYANFQSCSWKIELPTPGNIRLLFNNDFKLADDTLLIYRSINGSSDTLSLNVTETTTSPNPIDSPSGQFHIKFITNAIKNELGFSASYSIDCPDPKFNENHTNIAKDPASSGYPYGVVVQISCQSGNYFAYQDLEDESSPLEFDSIESVTMECLSGGKWNISRIPHCSPRFCGIAPVIVDGFVIKSTGVTYGSKVTYKCNNGFNILPKDTIECQANGIWETKPTCQASTCAAPSDIPQGTHNITAGDGTTFGSIVTYDCSDGYEIDGAPIKLCQSNGNWSENTPTCKKLKCPLPDIKNGDFDNDALPEYQGTRKVVCDTGYQINGTETLTCHANQTVDSAPTCDDINECDTGNGGCAGNCINTDGSFFCTCNEGYFLGVDNFSCEDAIECFDANGYCSQSCQDVPGGYTCDCNRTGYTLFTSDGVEGHSLPSSQDGLSFSDLYYINHTCVRKNCPDLSDIPNGVKSSKKQKFFFEDSVTYTCDIGFVIEGGSSFQRSRELKCLDSGVWSAVVPNCTVAQCAPDYSFTPTPRSPITPVLSNNGSLNYNEVLTITCNLEIPGINVFYKQRRCVYDITTKQYKLDGDDYDCGYVNCGEPPNYGNLKTWHSSLLANYGDTFEFQCENLFDEKGASGLGNKTVRCESNGQWDFGDLQCVGLTCSDPKTPPDAKQVGVSYEIGKTIKYTCNRPGFTLQPDSPLDCVINGTGDGLTWNGTLPRCVDTTSPVIEGCVNEVKVKKYAVLKDVLKRLNLKMSDNSIEGFLNVIDDLIGVLKVAFEPADANGALQITEDGTVNITVEDSAGNLAPKCVINLIVLDEVPPTAQCPQSITVYLATEDSIETRSFNLSSLIAADNVDIKQKLFNPQNLTLTSTNINSEPITVTGRVFDTSNNEASCTFEVSVKASSCSLLSKPVIAFANESCSGNSSSGYTCVYTCNTGYTLYDNPGSTVTAACSPGAEWNVTKYHACVKVPEDAIGNGNDNIAEYKYKYTTVFNSSDGGNVSSTCIPKYKAEVEGQYLLTNRLNIACDDPDTTITKKVNVNVRVELNMVIVEYTFTIGPQGLEKTKLERCYEDLKYFISDSNFRELVEMAPSGCSIVNKSPGEVLNASNDYDCKPERKRAFETKCLPCPVGSEWNGNECSACKIGFFKNTEGSDMCQPCAGDTLTYKEGTTDNGKCKKKCIPGRISDTQLPPCASCPRGKYSVNQTYCKDCDPGYTTNSTGSTSSNQCIEPCRPGFYSGTGYEPCTECPKNFYSNSNASTSCMECPDKKYTNLTASDSINDCMDTAELCNTGCQNNGTCILMNHGYICQCKEGFTGPECQWDINSCSSNPCHNGGTCTDSLQGYSCSCVAGTSGDRCQNNANDCAADTCSENGMCKDLINGAECLCMAAFSGTKCDIKGSICEGVDCGNGNCIGTVRPKCVCNSGYTGDKCGEIIDECRRNSCYYNGNCTTKVQNFTCSCQDGYNGTRCENRKSLCNGNTCGANGDCFDDYELNDYYCICKSGYVKEGTGKTCSEINECDSNPCVNGSCVNLIDNYLCNCQPGYIGRNCQYNIDDCQGNPCGEGKGTCNDGISSYSCDCDVGYESRNSGSGPTCEDIDNCADNPCESGGSCKDAVNDYICTCPVGYTGKNCSENIDDCKFNPCFHGGQCIDGLNKYTCNCTPGWTGTRCDVVVPHCNATLCKQSATCHDLFNNFFCECKPYTYGDMCENSARVCTNVDPCQNSATCNENDGNVNCTCTDSYFGTGCQIKKNFCYKNVFCKNGGDCTTTDVKSICKCRPGFSGENCELKDDNCDPACPKANCVNVDDKAYCDCPSNKEGAYCSKGISNQEIYDEVGSSVYDSLGISSQYQLQHLSSSLKPNDNFSLYILDLDTAYSLEFSDKYAMAYIPYPVNIMGDGLSISLNVRYKTPGASGTYFRFYLVPSVDSLDGKAEAFTMHDKGVTVITDNATDFDYPLQVNDGYWHSVIAIWNRITNEVKIVVDTIQPDDPNKYKMPPAAAVLKNIVIDLGSSGKDKEDGFIGSLSQVNIYPRTLVFATEVTPIYNNPQAVRSDILRGWNGYQLMGNVKRIPYSVDFSECPIGRSGTKCSTIDRESIFKVECNMDNVQHYSTERVSNVMWTEPTKAGATVVGTHNSGEPLLWGRYPVTYQYEDSYGNKALCHFKVYVQNDECSDPRLPFNGSQTCSENGKYKNCEAVCAAPNYKISAAIPEFYTCGPSGSWYPRWNKRFLPKPTKLYPACGQKQNPVKQKLDINLTYRVATPNCDDAGRKTVNAILRSLSSLNSQSGMELCSTTDCSDIEKVFKCSSSRRRRQVGSTSDTSIAIEISIPSTDPQVTFGGQMISASDLLTRTILATDIFKFQFAPVQTLDADTFVIETADSCPFGQTVVEGDCVSCPPGTYYNSTTALCVDCALGWWSDNGNQTACTQCENGKTTAYEGSDSMNDCKTSCEAGERFDLVADKCVNCSHGFYQTDEGQFFCYPCPAGTTTREEGSVNSTLCYSTCDAGYELDSTGKCVKCRIGYYRTLNSPSVCTICTGTYTLTKQEGSTKKEDCNLIACPVGKERVNDTLCQDCDIGYYQNMTNQDFCHKCDPGHRTENKGRSSQTDCKFYCDDGKYQKNNMSKVCEPCPFGLYRNNTDNGYDSSKCFNCPGNKRTNRTGSTSTDECTIHKCEAGFKPNSDNDDCESCPIGTYQHEKYQTFCYNCSEGESTRNNATKNASECERYCESGNEMIGGECEPCKKGTYRNMDDGLFEMCNKCPTHKTTPGDGAKTKDECSIFKCSPGYYRNENDTGCIECDLGSYQDKENAPNCTICPKGESTRSKVSNSSSQCEKYCASGFEKQGNECVGCKRGYYKDNNDGLFSMCVMCNISYITAAENSTSSLACDIENCTLGQKIVGKKCEDCGIGYYQDKLWQDNCQKCSGDKSTNNKQSTNETDCRLNCTVGQEYFGENCINCSVGFYKNVSGLEKCQKCPTGKTTAIEGADDITNCSVVVCEPGSFRNSSNICEKCGYGEYEDTTGKVGECKKCSTGLTTFIQGADSDSYCKLDCESGYEYVAARNECVSCGRGYYRNKIIEDQFQCVACNIEYITPGNASKSENDCNIRNCTTPGQYYDDTTKNCTDCKIGEYQDEKWQTVCKKCGDGKTTKNTKSVNNDSCILDCGAGTEYKDDTKLCKKCLHGYYRTVSEGLECKKCPTDLSTENEGAKSVDECTVSTCVEGKFFNKTTSSCENCPRDTYQPAKYQSSCIQCPNGRYTENDGQKALTSCKSYCNNTNKNDCSVNATCTDNEATRYTCKCKDDFQGNGKTCTHLCYTGYCQNNGLCVVGPPVSCTCGKYHKGEQCQTDVAAQDASDKLTETITIAVIAGVCGLLALLGLVLCIVRCCIKRKRKKEPVFQDSDYYGPDRHSLATKLSTRGYMRNDYDNYFPDPHLAGKEEFINPAYVDDAVYTA